MAQMLYEENDVAAIADSIRLQTNSTETFTISEMASAIRSMKIPVATDSTLGGIKVGAGLDIDSEGTLSVSDGILFGYDYNMNDSVPSTCISYVEGNRYYTAAKMNFSAGTFSWGSWENAWFMPKPCMLKFDGTVESYLDPNDYSKTTDGEDAGNNTSNTTSNAMMEFPIMWVKRWESDGVYHFRVAPHQIDSEYQAWANMDVDGHIKPFYAAIYFGSADSAGALRSLSGGTNYVSHTTTQERTAAALNGTGWDIERIGQRWLIADLLVLLGKSTNSQATFGYGVASESAAHGQGLMDDKGLFYGTSSTGNVKIFGMEHYYGNIWRRVVGWLATNTKQMVKITDSMADGSTVTGYNTTGSGYVEYEIFTGTNGSYINSFKVIAGGLIPATSSGGSSTTYACDGLWWPQSAYTGLAFVGGRWDSSAHGGCSPRLWTPVLGFRSLPSGPPSRLYSLFFWGFVWRFAYVSGNWNNSAHVGVFYSNLNNSAGNSNSNIGATIFILKDSFLMLNIVPTSWWKLIRYTWVSNFYKWKSVRKNKELMKSYKKLFNQLISEENMQKAARNVKHYKGDCHVLTEKLKNKTWKPVHHQSFIIEDGRSGKVRRIIKPLQEEQVVHHAIVQVMEPMMRRGMYDRTCGSIPGRGASAGKKYLEKNIRERPQDCVYCLKMDIRKFFQNINHDILMGMFEKHIKDKDMLFLLSLIVRSERDAETDKGLPIGFFTSQWFSNYYLQGLDHYIKEELKAKIYCRYMDDMIIFDSDKEKLHYIKNKVEEYLYQLDLELKDNWQVFRFDYVDETGRHGRFLDSMGWRFYSDKTTLRRRIYMRAIRKPKRMKVNWYSSSQMMSYLGFIKSANCHSEYYNNIRPYVDIKILKQTISNHDRGKR